MSRQLDGCSKRNFVEPADLESLDTRNAGVVRPKGIHRVLRIMLPNKTEPS